MELVFAYLPLSIQAITVPAVGKGWKQRAEEQRAKERTLEQAERFDTDLILKISFYVPLWAAQQRPGLSDEQKRRFQARAVMHGDADAAAYFGVGKNRFYDAGLCSLAARAGKLEALQRLRADGCQWDNRTCAEAAKGGHLNVLQWARAIGCDWDDRTCSLAAMSGHLAVLQWARTNGCAWDANTLRYASWGGGHPAVLEWARANGCPGA